MNPGVQVMVVVAGLTSLNKGICRCAGVHARFYREA